MAFVRFFKFSPFAVVVTTEDVSEYTAISVHTLVSVHVKNE